MTVPLGKKFIGGDPPLVSSGDESEGGGEKKSNPLLWRKNILYHAQASRQLNGADVHRQEP